MRGSARFERLVRHAMQPGTVGVIGLGRFFDAGAGVRLTRRRWGHFAARGGGEQVGLASEQWIFIAPWRPLGGGGSRPDQVIE